jgi:hypothetical protein
MQGTGRVVEGSKAAATASHCPHELPHGVKRHRHHRIWRAQPRLRTHNALRMPSRSCHRLRHQPSRC